MIRKMKMVNISAVNVTMELAAEAFMLARM